MSLGLCMCACTHTHCSCPHVRPTIRQPCLPSLSCRPVSSVWMNIDLAQTRRTRLLIKQVCVHGYQIFMCSSFSSILWKATCHLCSGENQATPGGQFKRSPPPLNVDVCGNGLLPLQRHIGIPPKVSPLFFCMGHFY